MLTFNEKNHIRQSCKINLDTLSESSKKHSSAAIVKHLAHWKMWQKCRLVVSFYPMSVEPDIVPLLANPGESREVCLVRTPDDDSTLLQVRRWDGSAAGLEPHPTLPLLQVSDSLPQYDLRQWASPSNGCALALVPGLAFTPSGIRMGRGKGWYDRFLTAWPGLIRVGICFSSQKMSQLPKESWDIDMDYLIDESGIHECSGRFRI
jgi:5-formyltetrahydrofolate cyclo-ligase